MYTQQMTAISTVGRLSTRSGEELRVRPFDAGSRNDYERAVRVNNAIDLDFQDSVEAWQHWDQNRDPKLYIERYLLDAGGETVAHGAFGHMDWSFHPDRYYIWLGVHPEHAEKGYGSVLWAFLIGRLAQRQPAELVSFTRENRPRAVEFLQRRGFEIRMRQAVSRINPQTFDVTPFAAKIARLESEGIAVTTLAEIMQRDPDWKRNVYELEREVEQDVPSFVEITKSDLEVYEKQILAMPNLLPEGWFVALDGDEYVGMSVLWRDLENPTKLLTGLTGVKRSHRRRGVATAMKASGLTFARESGAVMVDTDNEENNPMLQLNYQLGFRPLPAELIMQLKNRDLLTPDAFGGAENAV
jgi:GNAT superfamily N-acetyltransferase